MNFTKETRSNLLGNSDIKRQKEWEHLDVQTQRSHHVTPSKQLRQSEIVSSPEANESCPKKN